MANFIHEKFLIWAEVSKHHSVYRSEKITTPFLSPQCRGPCSYVQMTAALYQQTSLVSGKYFLYLIVSLQLVKFLSDTCFMDPSLFLYLSVHKQLYQVLPVALLFGFCLIYSLYLLTLCKQHADTDADIFNLFLN